jgi:hypothetical protein
MVTLMDSIVPWTPLPSNSNVVVKATHVDYIANNVVLLITSIHGNQMAVHPGCGMVLQRAKVWGIFSMAFPIYIGQKSAFIHPIVSFSLACNCHNHSDVCVYDESVADRGLSLNTDGQYSGGGICVDCKVQFFISKLTRVSVSC